MNKIKCKVDVNCDSEFNKGSVCKAELNLSSVIAITQALQFTIDHKKEFLAEYSCETCADVLKNIQASHFDVITDALEHKNTHHRN